MSQELAEYCLRYLDGDLTADEAKDFGQLLVSSPQAAEQLAQLALDEQHYRATPPATTEGLLPLDLTNGVPTISSALGLMPPVLVLEDDARAQQSENYRNVLATLTDPDFLRFVAVRALRTKTVRGFAAAAVLVLAVTLFFVFAAGNGKDIASPPLAGQSTDTQSQTPDAPSVPIVATLTAARNASWSPNTLQRALARGIALKAGSTLRPNDRLTLTAGFIEITTSRGAVAILQAPATIELLYNDNALYLHAGKLVGICETDASKGFLVRTPHMDITDLGTRFGVVASQIQATEVHVLEGHVQAAARSGQGAIPLQLYAGQSAKADASQQTLELIAYEPTRFASLLTAPLVLPGTGIGLLPGQNDANWQITELSGEPLTEPLTPVVFDQKAFAKTARENLTYLPNDPAQSQWIMPPDLYRAGQTQRYETRFDLSQFESAQYELLLRFIADSHVTSIQLNGVELEVPEHGSGPAFTEMTTLVIREGLVRGENRLAITVQRYRTEENENFWTGLRAELQLNQQGSPSEASP